MVEKQKSVAERCRDAYTQVVFTRAELRETWSSGRDITDAVRSGRLRRLRRNQYARATIDDDVAEAVRIGGRISCLSLLKSMGIFVLACANLHVQIVPGTSRIRVPRLETTRLHWNSTFGNRAAHAAHLHDAVRQSILCQAPRAALATLDSVLHHALMTRSQLEAVFSALPARYRVLLSLVDASAASGPETFMRLMLRALGLQYETQVFIPGVGYVDFLVDGWLIIECDSKEWHEGWEKQVEDRRRDMAAAKLGYVTLRPLASDILHGSAGVRDSVATVVAVFGPRLTAGAVHNSSEKRRIRPAARENDTSTPDLEEL